MGFKRPSMRVVIEDFIHSNPNYRKYFYCEECNGKMKFFKVKDNDSKLKCSKCGKEVED